MADTDPWDEKFNIRTMWATYEYENQILECEGDLKQNEVQHSFAQNNRFQVSGKVWVCKFD